MKTPEELLYDVRVEWHAHPDDYDPTEEMMSAFVGVVQADARSDLLARIAALRSALASILASSKLGDDPKIARAALLRDDEAAK